MFFGTLRSVEPKSNPPKMKFKTSLNKNSMVSKTKVLSNGSTFTEWVPAMPEEKVQIYRLANKTLRFGKIKAQPGSSGNYKTKNDFSVVFVPCNGQSSDYKLLVTKNAVDREFMLTHTPILENPRIRENQCPNCKKCPCSKLALTGCSEQQQLEKALMIKSLRLIKIDGRPYFEGNLMENLGQTRKIGIKDCACQYNEGWTPYKFIGTSRIKIASDSGCNFG